MSDSNLKIRADYPGGNIKVVGVEDRRVKIEQDLRDTVEWWFYWNFAAESMVDQEVVFQFTNGEVLGPWGPAVSEDLVNWRWLGEESLINREAFTYQFIRPGELVHFAFSIPYQVRNFESFYGRYQGHPLLERKKLTLSEQGRPVPMLVLGKPGAKKDLMFTARHHACEASASYLLEGLLGELLDRSQSPLWEKYRIHVVPLVDIDGVENGDQGKSRAPHDHNRDYLPKPVYRATSAIMEYLRTLHLAVGIDFHSPYKWGDRNDHPFFVKQASPIKEEIEKLGVVLRDISGGNLKFGGIEYDQKHDLEMGEEWNQPVHPNCSSFFRQQKAAIACTFEFPYFGTGNPAFTPENSRRFGADFAKALEIYLVSG